MGGIGSGRWQTAEYQSVEEMHALDVRVLVRAMRAARRRNPGAPGTATVATAIGTRFDFVTAEETGWGDDDRREVALTYHVPTLGGGRVGCRAEVWLSTTVPPLGGARWWAECPGLAGESACSQRVGVLYRPDAGHFACRQCWDLRYPSQRATKPDRLSRKADRLWHRAGESLFNPDEVRRPKGMHQRTHEELLAAARAADAAAVAAMRGSSCAYAGRLQQRVATRGQSQVAADYAAGRRTPLDEQEGAQGRPLGDWLREAFSDQANSTARPRGSKRR